MVYDEADEIYLQENNHLSINKFYQYFTEIGVSPQTVLFSATYPENVINNIKGLVANYRGFQLKNEALKLKGVRQFYITMEYKEKLNFIKDIYCEFEKSQTMIFTNKKDEAQML